MSYPVRIKVYGGGLGLLPPGTEWRIERVTEHIAPSGLIGEVMPEWMIIDLSPAHERPADAALREAVWIVARKSDGEAMAVYAVEQDAVEDVARRHRRHRDRYKVEAWQVLQPSPEPAEQPAEKGDSE